MSKETLTLTPALRDYMLQISLREHPLLEKLRSETTSHPGARMQIAPEQGQLMALLLGLIGATRVLEVGVFTGYSSLAMAMALPKDGILVACDKSEEYTSVARRYWELAGVSHKVDLRIGPALSTLDRMIAEGESGTYDFGFIDADKENDLAYFERLLTLLRPGGLVAIDNVLWSGRVIDDTVNDADTVAIREFNTALSGDDRVEISTVPIADGLTLAVKRS